MPCASTKLREYAYIQCKLHLNHCCLVRGVQGHSALKVPDPIAMCLPDTPPFSKRIQRIHPLTPWTEGTLSLQSGRHTAGFSGSVMVHTKILILAAESATAQLSRLMRLWHQPHVAGPQQPQHHCAACSPQQQQPPGINKEPLKAKANIHNTQCSNR